jgi:signal transduction histidine kinase
MNIIINSLQAMPRGGKLTITTDQQRNKQLISFADTGVGIAAGMVLDIFEPFYTTKHRGTGLGLNISYNIVKSHGGTIKVKSELGKGAIFTIVLPRE